MNAVLQSNRNRIGYPCGSPIHRIDIRYDGVGIRYGYADRDVLIGPGIIRIGAHISIRHRDVDRRRRIVQAEAARHHVGRVARSILSLNMQIPVPGDSVLRQRTSACKRCPAR
ncbi:hypothetical protein D3C77_582140 [compost metagenome]